MKESRLEIRVNHYEKQSITKTAKSMGMSVSNYIKFRIFESNPDIADEDVIYECPGGNIHNYNSFGGIYFNHYLIRNLIEKMYPEQADSMYKDSANEVVKKINSYGYRKINTKEDGDEIC